MIDLKDITEHRQDVRYKLIEGYLRETKPKARLIALAKLVRHDSVRSNGVEIQSLVKYADHMEDIAREIQ
jgi:hypothetical protein